MNPNDLPPDIPLRQPVRSWRRILWRLIQIVVTLTLIGVLARQIQWPAILALAQNMRWSWLALSCLPLLLAHLINVLRWNWLLQSPDVSYRHLLVYYGVGLFASNFLPTGVGGDVVRATLLSRETGWLRAIVSVGLDRGVGLISFSALLVLAFWLGNPPAIVVTNAWHNIALILLSGFLAVLLGWVGLRLATHRWRIVRQRWLQLRVELGNYGIWSLKRWLTILSWAYCLSVIGNLMIVASLRLVTEALGLTVPLSVVVWIVLLGSLTLLLPISINGLGVVEAVYVLVLGAYGASATNALAVALIVRIQILFFSLLGGLLSLAWNPNKQPAKVA